VVNDFSPVFNTIKEFNEIEALLELVSGMTKIIITLEDTYTVESVFGRTLLDIFEREFNIKFTSASEFQNTKLDFQKVLPHLAETTNRPPKALQFYFQVIIVFGQIEIGRALRCNLLATENQWHI
jgi:hypothetical protein